MKSELLQKNKKQKAYQKVFYVLLSFLFLIVVWSITSKAVNNTFLFPSLIDITKSIIEITSKETFLKIITSTITRVLMSFSISLVLAIIIGVICSLNKKLKEFIFPLVNIIKSIPTMSIILILIMLISITKAPLVVCIFVIFPILFSNIFYGIKSIDKKIIDMTKIYQISTKNKILYVYLPAIKNYIFAAVKSTFSLNIKVMVAAEVLGQIPSSIGNELMKGKIYLNISNVLAWTIIVLIISLISDIIIDLIFKTKKQISAKNLQEEKNV